MQKCVKVCVPQKVLGLVFIVVTFKCCYQGSFAISWIYLSASSLWFNGQSTFFHWAKDEWIMGWIYGVEMNYFATWKIALLFVLRGIVFHLSSQVCPDWESEVDDSNELRDVLVMDQTPLVLEVNTITTIMRDVIDKCKLGWEALWTRSRVLELNW